MCMYIYIYIYICICICICLCICICICICICVYIYIYIYVCIYVQELGALRNRREPGFAPPLPSVRWVVAKQIFILLRKQRQLQHYSNTHKLHKKKVWRAAVAALCLASRRQMNNNKAHNT